MMTITNYAKITIFFLADVLLNSYISDVMIGISTSRFGFFYTHAQSFSSVVTSNFPVPTALVKALNDSPAQSVNV